MTLCNQDYQDFFEDIFGDKNYLEETQGERKIYYPQEYRSILEKEEFTRMGKILQQGAAVLAYPDVMDTRLEHSKGTYEKMLRILVKLYKKPEVKGYIKENNYQSYVSAVLIRALLHDIGHSALSHSFEIMCEWPKGEHEKVGDLLIPDIVQDENVIEAIKESKKMNFLGLNAILEGEVDVDRLDFTERDSFFLGLYRKGEMQDIINQIIDSIDIEYDAETKKFKVVFPESQADNIDKFLVHRQRNYRYLPFNARVKAVEYVLEEFGKKLLQSDENHELKQFIQRYRGKNVCKDLDLSSLVQKVDIQFFDGIAKVALTTKDEELRTLALMCIPSIYLRRNLAKLENESKGETLSNVDEIYQIYKQFAEESSKNNPIFEQNCGVLSLKLPSNVELVYNLISRTVKQYLKSDGFLSQEDLQEMGIFYLDYDIPTYKSKNEQEIWIKKEDGSVVEYNKLKTKNGEQEEKNAMLFVVKPVLGRFLNKEQTDEIVTYIKEVSRTSFRRKQLKLGASDITWGDR